MSSLSENLSQIGDFLGSGNRYVEIKPHEAPRDYTPARGLRVCACMEKLLYNLRPLFSVFFCLSQPATSGFFRIFLAKPNNSAVRMLYGNRSNHVDLAVCFERFFFYAAAAALAFPCKTQSKVSGLNLFFVRHFHPFSAWAFPNAAFVGKNRFSCRGFFFPSTELSAAVCKRRSVESFFEA